ncbi:MAG: dihydroneopterin aldolase [Gammaproteobacteria bacterium]|nr:dihydroneopterin aldolase [Gammaproteobacteria bacterium]
MDTVFIRDLSMDAVIGVFGWERQVHQKITINLEMATDISKAAETDDLEYTLDYKAISQRIRVLVDENQPKLVETLIELIATTIMTEFNIPWLRITIAKPGAVRGSAAVGVTIERGERA